jgi:DHA2 family multidrug resistance protein
VILLMTSFVACALFFVVKTRRCSSPLIELGCFADRDFAIGCALSFVLGVGLFGSIYLMPFFLALVRGHNALQIGEIMLVTGVAQLVAAPVAVSLEQRIDARWLSGFGFALFAAGLLVSSRQTADTDAAEMLLPQIVRGAAIMFCILPPTRLALGRLPEPLVADGSGVFNLMRNLGGALGLALIDTTIFSRAATYGTQIASQLRAGNIATAVSIGIPRDAFVEQIGTPPDEFTTEMVRPLVEKAALVHAINDAWLLVGVLTALSLAIIPFVRRPSAR